MKRSTMLWWGLGSLALATALGAAVVFGLAEPPGFDVWWNATIAANRTDWMISLAYLTNEIGGGWIAILAVPLLIIAAFLIARRWRSAVFAALCFAASAGAVQLLKNLFGRARPDDMLVVSDFGSFPSGHTANAATIAVVLWLLFPRVWIAIVGAAWILVMALSRTVLSVHWATDTLGGALVGAGVVFVLAAWLLPWVRHRSPQVEPALG